MIWTIMILQLIPPSDVNRPIVYARKDPVVQIIVDDKFESRLIKSELTRNWSQYGLSEYDELRANMIVDKFIFIDAEDQEQYKKYDVKGNYLKFPVYRLYQEDFKEFPDHTFSCMTWPLKTMNVILNRELNAQSRWFFENKNRWNEFQDYKIKYTLNYWRGNCLQWHPGLTKEEWSYVVTYRFRGDYTVIRWRNLPNPEIIESMPGFQYQYPEGFPTINFPWE